MTGAAEPATVALAARRLVAQRVRAGVLAVVLVFAYLAYAAIAFDVPGLVANARPERAVLLGTDAIAHKVHVVKDLRRGGVVVAIEGERTATYGAPPDWVELVGADDAIIDLGDGHVVRIEGSTMRYAVPGFGIVVATVTETGVETDMPGPAPAWASVADVKLDLRPTIGKRVQVTRQKIEVHRYFFGWENFWFPFGSPLSDYSLGGLWQLAWSDERLDPARSNVALMARTFWTNPDWQHGHVFVALLETIMMAVLGTITAVLLGLPLAFLAARNFTPSMVLRFGVRRVFDFVRGIDNLIWSLIFIRAFGLGPLTGALAIAITDMGTLGKLFSEALENVDKRQIEGVQATGASQLQRYRYGVLPQILPVFVSQTLYYLESNTRSATVIGALGAGGIGLVLVETIRTSRDWENTLYIITLTVTVVILMDQLSGWLRRRLIQGA